MVMFFLTSFSLSIWLTTINPSLGLLCYGCDRTPHQRDCSFIQECSSQEACYADKKTTPDGHLYFKSGCKDKITCFRIQPAKRADIPLCELCCTSDYCNLELCDVPVSNPINRCLACDDVLHPEDCNLSVQCDSTQVCFVEQIFNSFREKRYRLGCAAKTSCDFGNPSVIGKRQINVNNTDYCAQCCTGTNCNRGLCDGSTAPSLLVPPSRFLCFDFNTHDCEVSIIADHTRCAWDRTFSHLFCPRSCGTCYGGGPIIQPTPSTSITTTPTTTMVTPINCHGNYSSIQCHKVHCSLGLCEQADVEDLCFDYCHYRCPEKPNQCS